MSKHTPGPWAYYMSKCEDGTPYAEIHPDGYSGWKDGRYLCVSGPIAESDARLIAAAPDLLEALKWMLALDEENHQRYPGDEDVCQEVQAARAAIAKATGEAA